jgi:hypothetical protein
MERLRGACEGGLGGHDLALPGFPELASAAPLGDLEAFVTGYLVKYACGQLPFRAPVFAVVERPENRLVLRKLLAQVEEIGGLPGEPVPVLC